MTMEVAAGSRGHTARKVRGRGWACTCGAGQAGDMTRSPSDVQLAIDMHLSEAVPVVPEDPAKLTGPELGARVRFTGGSDSKYSRRGQVGTVTARSYVWAPDQAYHYGEDVYYRGIRRYGDSVVVFDAGGSLSVLDRDLVTITELHSFVPGSTSYGQEPSECFYCWQPEAVHE